MHETKSYISLGMLRRFHSLAARPDVALSGLFAFEAPIVDPGLYRNLPRAERYFRRLYTWARPRDLKPYTGTAVSSELFRWPIVRDEVIDPFWSRAGRPGFIVMMNSNKRPRLRSHELYRERMRAVHELNSVCDIDVYGHEWHLPPYQLGMGWLPWSIRHAVRLMIHAGHQFFPDVHLESCRRRYCGAAADKHKTLSRYRFCLCYENMQLADWITEKIFDCFYAGTVPVYLGAPNIEDVIPVETFVDRRKFESYHELADHLKRMPAAALQNYREAARAFLESKSSEPFSRFTFARTIRNLVRQDSTG